MEREGWGIINSPSCSKEMVNEGEVLLAFAGEGVYVEGFYAVAKFYKAEGVVTLDLSEASGCFCGGGMVMWVVSEEIGIGESLDDEHVGTEEVTFRIWDGRKDPFGYAGGVSTLGKGIGAADIHDGVEGTAPVRICGVSHDSFMHHGSSLVMAIDDEFLHFGMRACSENVGSIVSRGGVHRADWATSISAGAGLCAVGQGAFEGTGGSPKLIDTDLKDLADGFEETGRGVPHVVAGGRECNGREGADPVVGG